MFTKPRGIHATFAVDCPRCDGEFTVTNGRIDVHNCRISAPMTVYATHEEVAEAQAIRGSILAKLEAAFDGR